ncbi:MAG: hypothetical protein RLY16_920 [Bacteroidota bacterium]
MHVHNLKPIMLLTLAKWLINNPISRFINVFQKRFKFLFFLLSLFIQGQLVAQVSQTFITAGANSFVVPAGVTSITVQAWGAGGGGSSRVGAAGGGGGGAYTTGVLSGLTPGSTINFTVGTGGTVGVDGTASIVNSITANGGLSSTGRNGGLGGAAVALNAVVTASFDGGDGGNAAPNTGGGTNNEAGGGGGGSAFTNAIGGNGANGGNLNNANTNGGIGFGNGGLGASGDGTPNASAGIAPGGGGGGRGESGGTSQSGANGRVIITYYPPTISNVTPATACAGSSTVITITGTNFTNASIIKFFNGVTATTTFVSSTTLTTTVPAGANTGVINVTTSGGSVNSTSFTVIEPPTVNVGSALPDICQGETSNPLGGSVGGSATGGIWTSSAGGTFSPDATTLNATWTPPVGYSGTATLTLTSSGGACSAVFATKTQVVNALPVVAPITGGSPTVCVNGIAVFSNATPGGTWSVLNGTGSAVITSGGLLTGQVAGTVTVQYTVTSGLCSASSSTNITVLPLPVVEPIAGGATFVCLNATTPAFTNATPGGTWSVLDGTGSASISPSGILTGLSTGTVVVLYTVSNGDCTNEVAANVTVHPIPSVQPITDGAATVCIDANTVPFNNIIFGGTWSVIDGTGSASINGGGVVTGLTAGTATVVYTVSNSFCELSTNTSITILPLPVLGPITGGAIGVCLNATTPSFSNATAGGTWSILNGTGTASINASGIVTGLSAGNVTIQYAYNNGICTNVVSTPLVVYALPLAGAITGTSNICLNTNQSLTPNPIGASPFTFNWSTTNNAVVSISNAGLATGNMLGTASIQYQATDVNGCSATSASFAVTTKARPTVQLNNATVSVCSGGSVTLAGTVTAIGAWTLSFSNGASTTGIGNSVFSMNTTPVSSGLITATSLTDQFCAAQAADRTGSVNVTVNNPVFIVTAPAVTQTVCSGSAASISVVATGTGLTYQWRKGLVSLSNGGNISGANSATLVLNPVVPGDAANNYNVVISGASPCTQVVSNNAAIVVNKEVLIVEQPMAQTVCSGTDVVFSVIAIGDGLTYQWRRNGVPLVDGGQFSGVNTSTLSITGTSAANGGNYSVVIAGIAPCATKTSLNARLTVNTIVDITSQPTDAAVCATFPVTFSIAATGTGLSYQWYKGTAPGTPMVNNANVSGVTTANLHFSQANIGDIADYYVVVTGQAPCAPVQSDYVHLSVDRSITILDQPQSQTICSGADVTFTVTADASGDPLLYQWRKNNIDIPGATLPVLNIIGATAADAGNYDVVITGIAGCITAYSATATLAVNVRTTGGFINSSEAVCQGNNSGSLTLSGEIGSILDWQISIDNGTSWNSLGLSTQSINYNNVAVETQYRAVVKNGVCPINFANAATLTMKPIPDVAASVSSQSVCSGISISSINLSGTVGGTVFNWIRDEALNVNGIASSGTGNISGSLTHMDHVSKLVSFTITPIANGCLGASTIATVLVKPTPIAIVTPALQSICSEDDSDEINFDSEVPSTTYSWTRNFTTEVTGMAISGVGTHIDATPVYNNTNASVAVTIAIVPTANGCIGSATNATMVVKPKPVATFTPASQSICSGANISSIVLGSNVLGTTFNWDRNELIHVTGIAANGTGNISGALTNQTSINQLVNFDITPVAAGCTGEEVDATVLVYPKPDVLASAFTQTVCSGTPISSVILSSPVSGTTFSWTRNNVAAVTGIPASGTGNISGTLVNTTNAPITVTFSVTPTANGCLGDVHTVTILVNPTPTAVVVPSSQTICSGATITNITFTGAVSGTTYLWTRDNTASISGIAASGSGTISGSLVSIANVSVPVLFSITPNANGCTGSIVTSTVTVKPTPIATLTPDNQIVCSGVGITTINLSSNVAATSYAWTRDNTSSATGIANSGITNISGTLTNTGATSLSVLFTVTPTANGCTGSATTATVVLNPRPTVVATPATQTVCSGATISNIVFTGAVSGTTYNWTRNNTVTTTGIAVSGSGDISGTIVNTTNAQVTSTLTVTPTANGCNGTAINPTIIVRPLPTIAVTNNSQTVCGGVAITTMVVSNPNAVTGTTFAWSRDNTANLTGLAASGTGANIAGTLNNATTATQTALFTITATANTCSSSANATINVQPKPFMTNVNSTIVCNNSTVSIPLTANVASNITWIAANNANVTGESTTLQSTSTISNTLSNASANNRQNVVYTVTPTAQITGCLGTAQTVTVTVLTSYNVTFNQTQDENSNNRCDGVEVGGGGQNDLDIWTGDITGLTLQWQSSIGSSTGPWSPAPGPNPNNTNQYVLPVSPSPFSGIGSYYFRLTVNGCESDVLSLTKTSTLTVEAGAPVAVCQSGSPAAITLTGAAIGGASTTTKGGTWSIASLNPSNGASVGTLSSTIQNANPALVTYTPPANYAGEITLLLTSNDPDGTGLCLPITDTKVITLTQAPIISNPNTLSICTGTSTGINLASVIPSTYTWTVGTITGGITGASSGSGNILNQTLTNPSTSNAGTVQYIITPTSIAPTACAAVVSNITVTVTPKPQVTLVAATGPYCEGSGILLTATNSGGTNNLLNFTGSSGTVNMAIPQSNTLYAASNIAISGSNGATIAATDVIQVTLNIAHGNNADLDIFLVDPSGTRAMLLSSDNGGTGNDYTNAILSTAGVTNVNTLTGNTNITGNYATEGQLNTIAPLTGALGGNYTSVQVPQSALLGASIDGNWQLRVFDDVTGTTGTLTNWSLQITHASDYSAVFNGPANIGAISYSGANSSTATTTVTPPVGLNNYTVTTTDNNGCSNTSAPVTINVSPAPTITGVSQNATVCVGANAQIDIAGLVPNSTSTITYTINAGATQTKTGVVADASGNASFLTVSALTAANNGQVLQITGVTNTSSVPSCTKVLAMDITLAVSALPTLASVTQPVAVCPGSSAVINLTGLLPGTTSTITYTINGGATQSVVGVVADGSGLASFNSISLSELNNGQILQITGITKTNSLPNCSQIFAQNVVLNVKPLATLSSSLTPANICSASPFNYTPTSASTGATFTWSRAAVPGIIQLANSGSSSVSEVLTNTTATSINVTYNFISTFNGCSNAPGQSVTVTVLPSPTISTIAQANSVCAGGTASMNVNGLIPNSASTIFYSINNVAQTPITNLVANASGTASFSTGALSIANNGQILKITGIVNTDVTPNCVRSVNIFTPLTVTLTPTLTAVAQVSTVCLTGVATISLSGLVPNSLNNTIQYAINGVAQTPVSGINANASGVASFSTASIDISNQGQLLTVSAINNGTCAQSFSTSTILAVSSSVVWRGVNTNWFDVQNWCGGIPTSSTDVKIPGSLFNYPLVNTGAALAKNLVIENGGTMTVLGARLKIAGSITNSGVLNATAGDVELNGSAIAQNLTGSVFLNNTVNSLIVSNQNGVSISSGLGNQIKILDSLAFGEVNNTILQTGDNVILASSAAKTARLADITHHGVHAGNGISGKVEVERFIPARRSWRLLTVPLQKTGSQTFNAAWQEGVVNPNTLFASNLNPNPGYGMHISGTSAALGFDPTSNNTASVKVFDPRLDTWVGIANTLSAKVTDSAGYMVFVRGNRSTNLSLNTAAPFSATILRAKGFLKTGLQQINIPATTSVYALVGNPYASAIDFTQLSKSAAISDGFVVWDPNLAGVFSVGAYQYFTRSGNDYLVFPGGGSYGAALSVNNFIQSGQAFMVQHNGAGTIDINEYAKVSNSSSSQFRPLNATVQSNLKIHFYALEGNQNTSLLDGALTLLSDENNDAIDGSDFRKEMNTGENIAIEKMGNLLAIDRRKPIIQADTIQLRLSKLKVRSYRMAIDLQEMNLDGMQVFLVDQYRQLQLPIDINGSLQYDFPVSVDSGAWNPSRFKLVFKPLTALPVHFTDIRANRLSNGVSTQWVVNNEHAVVRYEIERSADGRTFEKIGTVAAQRSNNAIVKYYNWMDAQPLETASYYRIKSVDEDGAIQYTRMVRINAVHSAMLISIANNPVQPGAAIVLNTNGLKKGVYQIKLLNAAGQVLQVEKLQHSNAVRFELNVKQILPSGTYHIEFVNADNEKVTMPLLILN